MVSHDCVAFYLLSEEVSRHVKVVQSGQGADEVLGGYDWYPPLAEVAPSDAVEAYAAGVLRPAVSTPWATCSRTDWLADRRRAHGRSSPGQFGRPGAETAVDAALRNDTTIMLVDDPVKRVDNMTMAWGLEARVPFLDHELVELAGRDPAGAEAGQRRQGRAEGGQPGHRARRGDRPDQGLLPGAGHPPARGPVPRAGARRRCPTRRPAARDCSGPAAVEAMLAAPNETRTTLGSNALWQLALLEMWLQAHATSA